jgi:hypothetical protein
VIRNNLLNLSLLTQPLPLTPEYFFGTFHHAERARIFLRCLWLFTCCKCLYWLVYFDLYFGTNSVVYLKDISFRTLKDAAFVLNIHSQPFLALIAILCALMICILNLSGRRIFLLSDVLLWLLIVNIHNRIYSTLTSGDILLNQLLILGAALNTKKHSGNSFPGLRVALHNISLIAVKIQVCLLYFLSGIAKLCDAQWFNGEAIPLISQVNHYSLPWASVSSSPLTDLVGYVVIFYQVLFPLLIWFRKIKKPFLVVGILMHLYISLVMGLFMFGIIMMICYLLFWPREKSSAEN